MQQEDYDCQEDIQAPNKQKLQNANKYNNQQRKEQQKQQKEHRANQKILEQYLHPTKKFKEKELKDNLKIPDNKFVLYTAAILYNQYLENKLIRGVPNIIRIENVNTEILDISLKAVDYLQDLVYATDQNIYHNIRRGLSTINIGEGVTILRKGLKKFFDIDIDRLNQQFNGELQLLIELEQQQKKQKQKQQKKNIDQAQVENKVKESDILHHHTFSTVMEVLDNNGAINIFITEKANGENAQVSYFRPMNAWVVASKNVVILCRTKDDFQLYKEIRYNFAILIATLWFEMIENHDQIDLLKNTLATHTLIAEYCGNPLYQHIVVYPKPQLRFYALVNKEDSGLNIEERDTCINPEKAFKFINDMNLIAVKYKQVLVNKHNFYQEIDRIYTEISKQTIDEAGEGCVLYFQDVQSGRCLSLGKLKTLDYRLHSRIREKLKGQLSAKGREINDLKHNFNNEVNNLNRKIKIETAQYNVLAEQAFDIVENYVKSFKNRWSPYEQLPLKKKASRAIQNQFLLFIEQIKDPNIDNNTIMDHILQVNSQVPDGQHVDEIEDENIDDLKEKYGIGKGDEKLNVKYGIAQRNEEFNVEYGIVQGNDQMNVENEIDNWEFNVENDLVKFNALMNIEQGKDNNESEEDDNFIQ